MSFYLSHFIFFYFYFSLPPFHTIYLSIPLSVLSMVNPSPPVDVSFPVSPPCLPHNLPLSLLGCSEGRPCQCVVCQCGNSREHRREPFTEARMQTDMRETPQCSLFLTAEQKTSYICAQYRNVHNQAPSHTHTQKQICNTVNTPCPLP